MPSIGILIPYMMMNASRAKYVVFNDLQRFYEYYVFNLRPHPRTCVTSVRVGGNGDCLTTLSPAPQCSRPITYALSVCPVCPCTVALTSTTSPYLDA